MASHEALTILLALLLTGTNFFVRSMDLSNIVPFFGTTHVECEMKCTERPWCKGIAYSRSMNLCYLLHSEQDIDGDSVKFKGKLLFVKKSNFGEKALKVWLLKTFCRSNIIVFL